MVAGQGVAVALQAYYEWMPVRPVDTNNPRKNNRAYSYGDLADLDQSVFMFTQVSHRRP